jgi:hypothetical protein
MSPIPIVQPQFYRELLGAQIKDKAQGSASFTMVIPGSSAQKGMWMSLTAVRAGDKGAGTYDHVGCGVDPLNSVQLMDEINKKWPFGKASKPIDPPTTNRGGVTLFDPDGLTLQLVSPIEQGELGSNASSIPNS